MPATEGGEAAAGRKSPWWQDDYQRLVHKVGAARGRVVEIRYRAGPRGEEEVGLTLRPAGDKGLELKSDMPGSALVSVDPLTGEETRQQGRFQVLLRDEDGDGWPEAAKVPPDTVAVEESLVRPDGMIQLTRQENDAAFHAMWEMYVGYAVAHLFYSGELVSSSQ